MGKKAGSTFHSSAFTRIKNGNGKMKKMELCLRDLLLEKRVKGDCIYQILRRIHLHHCTTKQNVQTEPIRVGMQDTQYSNRKRNLFLISPYLFSLFILCTMAFLQPVPGGQQPKHDLNHRFLSMYGYYVGLRRFKLASLKFGALIGLSVLIGRFTGYQM